MIFLLEGLLFFGLLAADLITKQLICAFLQGEPSKSFVVVKDVFTFTYSENDGAAMGSFSGNQAFLIIITILVCIAILFFLFYKRKASPKLLRFALVVILAGAVGNLVDRLAFGFVRDFLDYTFLYSWFGIEFAICNIADLFVFIGAIMLIFYVIFEYREVDFIEASRRSVKQLKSK